MRSRGVVLFQGGLWPYHVGLSRRRPGGKDNDDYLRGRNRGGEQPGMVIPLPVAARILVSAAWRAERNGCPSFTETGCEPMTTAPTFLPDNSRLTVRRHAPGEATGLSQPPARARRRCRRTSWPADMPATGRQRRRAMPLPAIRDSPADRDSQQRLLNPADKPSAERRRPRQHRRRG